MPKGNSGEFGVNDRRSGFALIENALIDDYGPIIGAYGIAAYCILVRFANRKGTDAYPSYQTVADLMATSRRTAMRTIAKLVEIGLVEKEMRKNKGESQSNMYSLLDLKKPQPFQVAGSASQSPPSDTNALPSDTDALPSDSQSPDQDAFNKMHLTRSDRATTTTTRDRAPEVNHHHRLAGPEAKGEAAPPEPTKKGDRTRQNDPAYNAICTAIESNGFGLMTPILATTVKTMMDSYPTDWILRALEIAVSSNVIRINYVKGVLDNWQREGFGNDNRKYNKERAGNHPAPADDERTSRQRQYNERHTSLMADQINGVITSDEADRRWAELETEFPDFEYEKLP